MRWPASTRVMVALVVVIGLTWAGLLLYAAREVPGTTITLRHPGDADLDEADAIRLGAAALGQVTRRDASEFRPMPYREGAPGVFARRPNATSSGYVLWLDVKSGGSEQAWHFMTTIERIPDLVQVTVLEGN